MKENGFDMSVCDVFMTNKIDGSTLLELIIEDMKELGIKALGDRKKLERVMKSNVSLVNNSGNIGNGMVSYYSCFLMVIEHSQYLTGALQ